MKISPVDVEIIGLKEIAKIYIKNFKKHQQNISPAHLRFAESGWANKQIAYKLQ